MSYLAVLSPYVRHADDNPVKPPWKIGPRHLWDYEILYLKQGRLRITIEQKTYEGVPGDIFIFKPRQLHSILLVGHEPLRQPHVHFDLIEQTNSPDLRISFRTEKEMNEVERTQFRADLLSKDPLQLPNHIRLPHPAVFEQMLYELIQEFSMKLPLYEMNCKAMMIRMLTYLAREQQWSRSPNVQSHIQTLMNIQQYLHSYEHEISLLKLADQFCISKYYLNRLFSDAFGMGPIQYHQMMRIQKAKQLLQYTNMSIQEIADQLGYQNIHSFSRAFKNKEGVAPSQFRKG